MLQAAPPEVTWVMVGKWIQRGLLVGTALLGAATVGSGCAEPESSLFIRQVVFLQPPDCAARAEPDGLSIGLGTLDVALRDEYSASLLVGNQLVARGSTNQLRTETSRIELQEATVSISLADGTQINSFTVPVTGFADQASGQEPGYGIVSLPLIDAKSSGKVRATLVATAPKRLVSTVKIKGRTLGGAEVESNEFQFVIQACNGCLVSFDPANDDPTRPGVDCYGAATNTATSNTDAPCRIGQDVPVSCANCAGLSVNCLCRDGASTDANGVPVLDANGGVVCKLEEPGAAGRRGRCQGEGREAAGQSLPLPAAFCFSGACWRGLARGQDGPGKIPRRTMVRMACLRASKREGSGENAGQRASRRGASRRGKRLRDRTDVIMSAGAISGRSSPRSWKPRSSTSAASKMGRLLLWMASRKVREPERASMRNMASRLEWAL